MTELKPLDVVDNRTIEQVRADGDDRLSDGSPYIKDGVCCVCSADVEKEAEKYPVHVCLVKLEKPVPCETWLDIYEPTRCQGTAYWASGATADEMGRMCDKCLMGMLEILPDNREWFEPALADIRERHLKIGARVRIQMGEQTGKLGTVYNHLPSRPAPWHVRPDSWPEDVPGIAYKADELDVML